MRKLLIIEIRRRQQKRIPLLLRSGVIEGFTRMSDKKRLDRLEIEPVGQLWETPARRRSGVFRIEQSGAARTDGARYLEAAAHLAGTRPTQLGHGIAVR